MRRVVRTYALLTLSAGVFSTPGVYLALRNNPTDLVFRALTLVGAILVLSLYALRRAEQ